MITHAAEQCPQAAYMVAAVQLVALLLALLLALWRLAWRPRAVARSFARQGIRGPPYTFLAGSLPEAKRLLIDGRRRAPPLDAGCHDIIPVLLPQFQRWVADYGNKLLTTRGVLFVIFMDICIYMFTVEIGT